MEPKIEKFRFALVKGWVGDELEAVASTGAVDRDGEIISPSAWKDSLDSYRANPVILATHQHRLASGDSPVIGSASRIDVDEKALTFAMRFAGTELGKQYAQLYREGHMRAFSVGFIPQEGSQESRDVDGKSQRIYVHSRVQLLEISAVPVPANPEALARMRAAMAGMGSELKGGVAEWIAMMTGLKAMIAEVAHQVGEDGGGETVHERLNSIEDSQALIIDAIQTLADTITLSPDTYGLATPDAPEPRRRDVSAARNGDGDHGAHNQSASAAALLAKALAR